MHGVRIVPRLTSAKDGQPSLLKVVKLRACKYGSGVRHLDRLCLQYLHAVFWLFVFAFIVTLVTTFLWLSASDEQALEFPAFSRERFLSNYAVTSRMQGKARLFSSLLELKKEAQVDIYVRAKEKAISRDNSTFAEIEEHELVQQGGRRNSSDLSVGYKIYVYDLPSKYNEDWLEDSRCSTHLFAAEVAIHKALLSSPIRTLDPDQADLFFVPVYVSCNFSLQSGFPSLGGAPLLLHSAIRFVSHELPYWNRSEGSDHIFVATHDYGACFHAMEDLAVASGVPEFLRKSVILQTFGRKHGHPCQNVEHIQIPPFVSLPPLHDPIVPPQNQKRNIWAYFRGKIEVHPKNISGRVYSRGIRTVIWRRFGRNRRFYIKRKHSAYYQAEIGRSVFCLCPLGWAPWSPRIVESVIFGCVPVIIADDISLPYSHSINWSQISLSVREKDIGKLDKILDKVSRKNLTTIQKNLWREENRRALTYMQPMVKGDATWQMLQLLKKKLNRSRKSILSLREASYEM